MAEYVTVAADVELEDYVYEMNFSAREKGLEVRLYDPQRDKSFTMKISKLDAAVMAMAINEALS